METKPLLYGLIGFFLGGLIVSIAATTFNAPDTHHASDVSMSEMADSLKNKQGDDFDKAFITGMIEHHEGAVAMAKLSAINAKHDEIKRLSNEVIAAQQEEIERMRQWQVDWNYPATKPVEHGGH